MALPKPPKPKVPGQRSQPTKNQQRPVKKPKAVGAAERVIKFIDSMNPFD